jgi:predicted signal transduction protein with EAL and GGDEF domain
MAGTGLNGEVISGISLTVFGIMLLLFGTVNQVAAILIPADILIISIGIGVILVGVFTNRKNPIIRS